MITKMRVVPKIIDRREGGRNNYCHVRKRNNIYNTHIRELVIY